MDLRQLFAALRDVNEEFVQKNILGEGSEGEIVTWYPNRTVHQTALAAGAWEMRLLLEAA